MTIDVAQGHLGFEFVDEPVLDPLLSEHSQDAGLLLLIELFVLQHVSEGHLGAPDVFIHLSYDETFLLLVVVLVYVAVSV